MQGLPHQLKTVLERYDPRNQTFLAFKISLRNPYVAQLKLKYPFASSHGQVIYELRSKALNLLASSLGLSK